MPREAVVVEKPPEPDLARMATALRAIIDALAPLTHEERARVMRSIAILYRIEGALRDD